MNEAYREIYQAHRTVQDKYIYFLLAAAGAGIGFAISQTQHEKLSYFQLPLAISVACWGLSFFFGCKHQIKTMSTLYMNMALFEVHDGIDPTIGSNPIMINKAEMILKKAMEKNAKYANRFFNLQFAFIIIGAILFIVWHIIQMALR